MSRESFVKHVDNRFEPSKNPAQDVIRTLFLSRSQPFPGRHLRDLLVETSIDKSLWYPVQYKNRLSMPTLDENKNSIKDGIQSELLIPDGMNPAHIPGTDLLIVRRLFDTKPEEEKVDASSLDIFSTKGENLGYSLFTAQEMKQLKEGKHITNLEDPRVFTPIKNGPFKGQYDVGVTAVCDENGEQPYYPARFRVAIDADGKVKKTSSVDVFKKMKKREENGEWSTHDLRGKNFTPVGEHQAFGEIYLTRPDDGESHSLSLVTIAKDGDESVLIEQKRLTVPPDLISEIPWLSRRIGTTGGPLLDEQGNIVYDKNGNMTLMIHGQEEVDGVTIYRLGAMTVTPDWDIVGITKDHIADMSNFPARSLRSNKEVVYSCDTPVLQTETGMITFYPAAGDTQSFQGRIERKVLDKKIMNLAEIRQEKEARENPNPQDITPENIAA